MDASFGIMSFFPYLHEIANPEALKATVRVFQIRLGYVESFNTEVVRRSYASLRFFKFAIVSY
jgi:hypothetical protein